MIDMDLIRNNPKLVKDNIKKRGMNELLVLVDDIHQNDVRWRKLKAASDKLRASRNTISKEINEAKKAGKSIKSILVKAKKIPVEIDKKEKQSNRLRIDIDAKLMHIPNILDSSVPKGEVDGDNVEIRKWGKIPNFKFELKNHIELCEELDLADFERSSKIAGSGFYFLKNGLVMLEQALIRFVLDILQKKGFTLMTVPLLMRRKPYQGVTDMTSFEEVMYKIEGEDQYLIATSEHPLVGQFMGEVLDGKDLPLQLAGVSSCFRKEAGTHSVDEKGLFRVHQFTKVEQVVVCKPDESMKLQEELISVAEDIFRKLNLPYRIMLLCSGDTGRVMSKTYDLEVWMPRQEQYREAVSCSSATDYQARRLGIKYREAGENKFVHTLNSTAIALSRAIVAILENYQQKDGTVKVPAVLVPYLGGLKVFKR
jgi:seryl-tRNA synthetase